MRTLVSEAPDAARRRLKGAAAECWGDRAVPAYRPWRGGPCVPGVRRGGLGTGTGGIPSAGHGYFRLGAVTQERADAAGSRSTCPRTRKRGAAAGAASGAAPAPVM